VARKMKKDILTTADRILSASRELFFKHGLKSITMDDIARHLGMSKKTIYQFFEDKNKLIVSLNKNEMTYHQAHFDEISKNAKNAIDEIFQMMNHLHRIFSAMNPNLLYDMQKHHPEAWSQHLTFKEKCVYPKVEENLKRGIKEGLYRENLNIKLMTILRMEQFNMALDSQIIHPGHFNIGEVHVLLLDHFLHGISTLKGHKLINNYKQINEEE
jgi:TetR/AcrR family transcriptional regulator, cholesterol catabolism regulator